MLRNLLTSELNDKLIQGLVIQSPVQVRNWLFCYESRFRSLVMSESYSYSIEQACTTQKTPKAKVINMNFPQTEKLYSISLYRLRCSF